VAGEKDEIDTKSVKESDLRLQKNSIFYQSWFSDAERVKNQIDLNEIQNNKQRNQSIEEVMLDIETNLKLTLV